MEIYCDCEVPQQEVVAYTTKAHGKTVTHYKKVAKCGLCLRKIKRDDD